MMDVVYQSLYLKLNCANTKIRNNLTKNDKYLLISRVLGLEIDSKRCVRGKSC